MTIVAATTVVFISLSFVEPSQYTNQRNRVDKDVFIRNQLSNQVDSSDGVDGGLFSDSLDHVEKRQESIKCGIPSVQPSVFSRIIGGSEATPHSWPWQVSIRDQKMNGGRHICGGSIINSHWILTAAHCIGDSVYAVVVGLHNRSSNALEPMAKTYPVAEVVIYDGYVSANFQNDLALLRIAEPIRFNAHVQPICLPENAQEEPLNNCVITGWGDTRETGNDMVLNQVQTSQLDRKLCRFGLNVLGQPVNNDKIICAGVLDGSKDACHGDSGGPLVCLSNRKLGWEQQGIISVGIGCSNKRNPGLYTRVSSFINWIKSKAMVKSSSKPVRQ